MTILRKNTNPRATDISPQLQSVLNANGMQAHIGMDDYGNYQLITMSHNTDKPRFYKLNQQQVETLRDGGTNIWDKQAYNTFISIIQQDYYIPGSFVAARNANSPVNLGLQGHRLNPGEYGYMGHPVFRSFRGSEFGRFDSIIDGLASLHGDYRLRRIAGRPYYATHAPVVVDRPDEYLKPGELSAGSYGFYDKGIQQADPLSSSITNIEQKKIEYPKGQSIPLNSVASPYYLTSEQFLRILASHGVEIDEKNKTLTIKSTSIPSYPPQYQLTNDEVRKLTAEKFKYTDKKGEHNKKGVSVNERLAILNTVIAKDFADKLTVEQLNSKDYVNIKLKPEVEKELNINQDSFERYSKQLDIINVEGKREDYHTGYIDKWNSIGVVDGRSLPPDKGFYLPVKDGRAVSVGEIQVSPVNDGNKTTFRMTAVINNQVMSHEISKDDYIKFINYNDEYRLKLFDKVFDEVSIKDSSNGKLQDPMRSGYLDEANSVVTLHGNYNLVNEKSTTAITGAMAWKDNISGNYMINVRDSKDIGMWSFKISEAQYLAFKDASNDERAKMLTSMIPFKDENKQLLTIVKSKQLPLSVAEQNLNTGLYNERTANTVNKNLLNHIEGVNASSLSEKDIRSLVKNETELISKGKERPSLETLRHNAKMALTGDYNVNGESLENLKTNKEWTRSGNHGRKTDVGDITVYHVKDKQGKIIEGKYKMAAIIDGNYFEHDITQKEFNKFRAVNDVQRMKLFDKIFPEVEMKTKPGHGFNLGAAILAAVSVSTDVMGAVLSSPHPRPEFYSSQVFSKPGVVAPEAVAAAKFESLANTDEGPGQSEGRGIGV